MDEVEVVEAVEEVDEVKVEVVEEIEEIEEDSAIASMTESVRRSMNATMAWIANLCIPKPRRNISSPITYTAPTTQLHRRLR